MLSEYLYFHIGAIHYLSKKGIELCTKLQKAIVEKGISLIEKKSIIYTRCLRFSILSDMSSLHLFAHPLTLSRLASFLIEALRVSFSLNVHRLKELMGSHSVDHRKKKR